MTHLSRLEAVVFPGPFVGIDPASLITTIVVLQGREHEPWVLKRIGVRGAATSRSRYGAFTAMVSGVLRALDALPALRMVAIKGYNVAGKNRAHAELVELGALLRQGLLARGWPLVEAPPATVRKFVTGDGNSELGTMMRQIESSFCRSLPRGGHGAYVSAYALAQVARCLCYPAMYAEWQVAALEKIEALVPPGA